MERRDNESAGDWLRRWLDSLRRPARLDQTPDNEAGSPADPEGDELMLSLVVSDALAGEDIARLYPAFFRQMLVDEELREAFLDTLDILEKSRSGQLELLPGEPSADLSFLSQAPRSESAQADGAHWRFFWRQTIEALQAILFSAGAGASPVYRQDDIYGHPYFTLLNSEADAPGLKLAVLLEAEQPLDRPDELTPLLTVLLMSPYDEGRRPLTLAAHLRWGGYERRLRLRANSQATFDSLPMDEVLNTAHSQVIAALELALEPAGELDMPD
jgi:hypothetical protein